ncbi:uncharacterized protein LOC123314492 [Coccinella septempunctata]|uniref:uncharacterized protein LOC123314492 n=1 Tax=Coccinella septempunctata TaxID=41139 RepID=UPI001D075453|nr:uncharacterized protein LOC123314492 [Coccinella septempunctata]
MAFCGIQFFVGIILIGILGSAMALKCFICGMYNDGVGSITPCINDTNMPVRECQGDKYKFCIKYQSEGSTVRDCVVDCTEREDWGSKTYCCNEDSCNSSIISQSSTVFTAMLPVICFLMR